MTREEVKDFMDEFISTHYDCKKTTGGDDNADYYKIGTSLNVRMYESYMEISSHLGKEEVSVYVYYKHIEKIRPSFTPDTWFIETWLVGSFVSLTARTKVA